MWHWLWDRERTVCAFCFLPAKTHSVLSCSVSPVHTFEFLSLVLSLRPRSLSLSGSDRTEVSVRRTGVYLYSVWGEISGSVCRSFLTKTSVTSPLTEPIRLWTQQRRCRVYKLFISSDGATGLSLTITHEAAGQLPKNTQPQESGDENKPKQEQTSAQYTLEWL